MRRIGLVLLVLIGMVALASLAAAQGDTYPLQFEYDGEYDEFYAELDLSLSAGDRLQASVQGGDEVYFFVYTDDEDIYEGESLDGFVAPYSGYFYLDVASFEDASGSVTVIPAYSDTAPAQPAAGTGGTAVSAGEFRDVACPFDTPPELAVRCGVLTVPENRLVANGRTVELMVAIIPAQGSPLPDPIFYLEGGPGGSALAGIDSWYNTPYRAQREIVIFDQRGTGYSTPSLNCPELDVQDERDGVEACRDRLLAQGVDLTAYNSRENAADVEALRLALGYDQVNLYGISYGTRLALTVMRDHPAGLRSVVLDSVYPPNVDTDYLVTTDTYTLISLMFADCAAQPACAAAFPNLETRFYDALDAIDADPPTVYDPETDEEFDLFAEDVIIMLSDQLQTTTLVPAIPASLDALANGDYDLYMDLALYGAGSSGDTVGLAQELAAELFEDELNAIDVFVAQGDTAAIVDLLNEVFDLDPGEAELAAEGFMQMGGGGGGAMVSMVDPPDIDDDAEGMFYSVQCHEEVSFMTEAQAEDYAYAVAMPEIVRLATLEGSRGEFDDCAVWPAGVAAPVENQPVVSAIPTLVLAARYDTATPPSWADLAASTLSRSYTYHFPLVGHGVIDGGPCPVQIGLDFLAAPQTAPDASCIAGMNTQFYIP